CPAHGSLRRHCGPRWEFASVMQMSVLLSLPGLPSLPSLHSLNPARIDLVITNDGAPSLESRRLGRLGRPWRLGRLLPRPTKSTPNNAVQQLWEPNPGSF